MPSIKTLATLVLAAAASVPVLAAEIASFAVDTEVKLMSDQRTRGISDSMNRPALELSAQVAHESGLIGLFEFNTVSKKGFLGSDGYDILVAGGWRFGDPDAWHFGLGLAAELFPGAKFEAPHAIDLAAGASTDYRKTKYDTAYTVLEIGYGAIEGRILNVVSKNYRGANTGGVCGTLISLQPDPTAALECYARGDHNSRGSWLAEVSYKFSLAPDTTLSLHAGMQRVRNFKEANFSDYSVGIMHRRWGLDWSAEWMGTRTKARELYIVIDGDKLHATDDNQLVLSVARKF